MSSSEGGLTRVVFGPRTRLGGALLAQPLAAGARNVVVARHEADVAALSSYDAPVLPTDAGTDDIRALMAPAREVQVQVCALGPLHPGTAQQAVDSAHVARDLGVLERVLDVAGDRTTDVVLISTVVALAPAVDRRYYGGWRGVVEQELREVIADRAPQVTLRVLYPGRLTETRDFRHPTSLGYTTYRKLAELAARAGQTPEARLVGFDARAWLLARSLSLGLNGLIGRWGGDRSLTDRMVRATRQEPSRSER